LEFGDGFLLTISDFGDGFVFHVFGLRILVFLGCGICDVGFGIWDFGFWILDFGFWGGVVALFCGCQLAELGGAMVHFVSLLIDVAIDRGSLNALVIILDFGFGIAVGGGFVGLFVGFS